ncbi:MAG: ROK family protein [Bacteroidales bacterium]|jgi:glucokinase
MDPNNDKRIVLTLDAGGTNFVFSAMQANREITEPVILPPNAGDLGKCIETIAEGFKTVMGKLNQKPVAISFAFPGPGDYASGIIGDLNNLPAFRGGVPLGPILRSKFRLPVFINNDGDLYAYGEALSGFLPYVNRLLHEAGINKQYHNLMGFTLGTGFGAGLVRNNELIRGDNSAAGEVWLFGNRHYPSVNAEEGISIRAIKRVYAEKSGMDIHKTPEPKDIYEIAAGRIDGNTEAAKEAFRQLGTVLGDVLANLITVFDGAVVIGGGISGAMSLIYPPMMKELGAEFSNYEDKNYPRLVQKVYYINDPGSRKNFLTWKEKILKVPGTDETIQYSPEPRIPVGTSEMGTSRAIAAGAYAFALHSLK